MRLEAFTQAHYFLEVGSLVQRGPGSPTVPGTPAPALIKDTTSAACSPQHTAATQERFGLSHSSAAISKETSISVQHPAEKYQTQARAHGGAANLAAGCCGSKSLSSSGHQHHVEEAWVHLILRD